MSNLSAFEFIGERSEATPGLFNRIFSTLSNNLGAIDSSVTLNPSSGTVSITSNLSIGRDLWVQGALTVGAPASVATRAAITMGVRSDTSDYLYFTDSSALRSSYIIGSKAGGTADGLNIYDASGSTMIVSFSKQSIRFYQNVVGPVFDVGGALASTLNAATFGTGADSRESRIQAAISAASAAGIVRVYVPANLYPYSGASLSFDTRVQMVREGGDWSVYDIIAYGANGNNSTGSALANAVALQSAVSGANADPQNTGLPGGIVFVPPGNYVIARGVRIPPAINSGQVILRGAGMRVSYLLPQTSVVTALLFGSATLDASGSFTSQTFYCGLEDLSLHGSLITDKICAVQFTEMQKGWMRNSIIESCNTPGAIGLYLRGSNGAAAPHAWRNSFFNVVVATTNRPLLIENGDENDFFNCNFAGPAGKTSAITAAHVLQGRNNRFFGLLLSGEASSFTTGRPGYTGLLFGGQAAGDCSGNQVYGMVAEGFDSGVSVASNATNISILFYNPSINRLGITDAGTGTVYLAPQESSSNPIYQWPPGTANAPAFAFRSEGSLGWYRSGASVMALAPEGRLLVGSGAAFSLSTQPEYGFGGEPALGMLRSAASTIGFYAGAVRLGQFLAAGGLGALWVEVGSNTSPSVAFALEPNLGLYRSGTSTLALSYGTLTLGQQANFLQLPLTGGPTSPSVKFGAEATGMNYAASGQWDAVGGGAIAMRFSANQGLINAGSAILPTLAFISETSLGVFRSGSSTIALSYGTLNVTGGGAVLSVASLTIKAGANNSCGTAVLGSNGSVNVANTYVKTGDLIFLTDQTPGGTLGDLEIVGIRNSSGFTIASTSVTDTSTVAWLIVRPG